MIDIQDFLNKLGEKYPGKSPQGYIKYGVDRSNIITENGLPYEYNIDRNDYEGTYTLSFTYKLEEKK